MSTTTGKTLGVIALVLILAVFALRFSPVVFGPFLAFSGMLKGLRIPGDPGFLSGMRWMNILSMGVLPLLLLAMWIGVIIWVSIDAEKRGMSGVLWALLVFFGNLVALIIYLILRNERPAHTSLQDSISCPECSKPLKEDFSFCPHCGARLKGSCPKCGESVAETWAVCPHCGVKLAKGR